MENFPYGLTLPDFYKEILISLSVIFQRSQPSCKGGGGGEVIEGVHPMNVSSGNNTNTLTSRERNLNWNFFS